MSTDGLGVTIDESSRPRGDTLPSASAYGEVGATPALPSPRRILSPPTGPVSAPAVPTAAPWVAPIPTAEALLLDGDDDDDEWREGTELDPAARRAPEVRGRTPGGRLPTSLQVITALRLAKVRSGERFGRYALFGMVGAGGMAEVRLAYEELDGGEVRPCVVKRIAPPHRDDAEFREMFREEARVGRLLGHANVVEMFDAGELDGVPYIAFELVDGITLAHLDRLHEPGPLPVPVVVEVAQEIARALAYAHELRGEDGQPLGLVHRDMSPQNVLIARDGRVKLADFGIARFAGRAHETQAGLIKGKMRYLAPEQFQMVPLDGRTDLFSLGVVMAELLTGRTLFPASIFVVQNASALLRDRLGAARVPPDLIELIVRMAAERREDRPDRAAVVARALGTVRAGLPRQPTLQSHLDAALAGLPGLEDGVLGGRNRRPMERALSSFVEPTPAVRSAGLDGDTAEDPPPYPTAIGLMFPELFGPAVGARGDSLLHEPLDERRPADATQRMAGGQTADSQRYWLESTVPSRDRDMPERVRGQPLPPMPEPPSLLPADETPLPSSALRLRGTSPLSVTESAAPTQRAPSARGADDPDETSRSLPRIPAPDFATAPEPPAAAAGSSPPDRALPPPPVLGLSAEMDALPLLRRKGGALPALPAEGLFPTTERSAPPTDEDVVGTQPMPSRARLTDFLESGDADGTQPMPSRAELSDFLESNDADGTQPMPSRAQLADFLSESARRPSGTPEAPGVDATELAVPTEAQRAASEAAERLVSTAPLPPRSAVAFAMRAAPSVPAAGAPVPGAAPGRDDDPSRTQPMPPPAMRAMLAPTPVSLTEEAASATREVGATRAPRRVPWLLLLLVAASVGGATVAALRYWFR